MIPLISMHFKEKVIRATCVMRLMAIAQEIQSKCQCEGFSTREQDNIAFEHAGQLPHSSFKET